MFILLLQIPMQLLGLDYYWIGGSGNWSDINHWSAISGSNSQLHNTTPSSTDDVYIDANSIGSGNHTININLSTAFCRNITITNLTGTLYINLPNNSILRIFGKVDMDKIHIAGFGSIVCEAPNTGNIIRTSNTYIPNLSFSSAVGGWLLQDSLYVGNLNFTAGQFVSNQNVIQANYFNATNASLNLDSADVISNYFVVGNVSLSFNLARLTVLTFATINALNAISVNGTRVYCYGYSFVDKATQLHKYDSIYFLNSWAQTKTFEGSPGVRSYYVMFEQNGNFKGNWRTDSLDLTKSMVYLIEIGSVIQIDKINAIGDCANWINIECEARGSMATINLTSANSSAFIRFRDINKTGSTWNVSPHVKFGNVIGIGGVSETGKKMYWVGGSGHWRSPTHWSLTDGGAPANCIPTPLDTVYFTDNSGTSAVNVVMGDSVIQFHSLFCINQTLNISISGHNLPIQAIGSFILSHKTNWQVSKKMAFYGTANTYTIFTAGKNITFLTFLGGGKWTLLDTLNADELSIVNGQFDAGLNIINVQKLIDNKNEWRQNFAPTDVPTLNIANTTVNVSQLVQFEQNTFVLSANNSRVNCAQGVQFFTFRPTLQWNIVEWTNSLGTAKIQGSLKGIRQLILNSEAEVQSDLLMDTLTIKSGNSYYFNTSVKFLKINALGTCNKNIIVRPFGALSTTHWEGFYQTNSMYYTLFQNVHFTNGTLNAYNSFNLSGNSGINFINSPMRTLYWVGGTGNWEDSTHWSLTSGGMGGECIPTPADSVIFDNNSSTANMFLRINNTSFARDLMMLNTTFTLSVVDGVNIQPTSHIEIYGNVQLSAMLNFSYGKTFELRASAGAFFYKSNNSTITNLRKYGNTAYTLIDDLKAYSFVQYGGLFNCANNDVDVGNFLLNAGTFTNGNADMEFFGLTSYGTFIFPNCDVVVKQNAFFSGQVNSALSQIVFTSTTPHFTTSSNDTITKVIFINPLSKAQVSIINSHVTYIEFQGWAYLNRGMSVDTAVCTNGNSYFFTPTENHKVYMHFDVKGDFCNAILLRSMVQGTKANIYAMDTVDGDFLEIRDLNFAGPSHFYTGSYSADQGNNTGFIWGNKPGYIFGLGLNRFLIKCSENDSSGITIKTNNFQDAQSFLWHNNSTADSLFINQSATIWVTANYVTCEVTDTILVHFEIPNINVPDSSVYCEPTMLTVSVVDSNVAQHYNYLWSTGHTTANISFYVYKDTVLYCEVTDMYGKSCMDTVHLFFLVYDYSPKSLSLLNCENENLEELIINHLNLRYYDSIFFDWSAFDSTNNRYYDYLYFTVVFENCFFEDSIALRYDNPFPILPTDSILCLNSTITFTVQNLIPEFNYAWSTGDIGYSSTKKILSGGQVNLTVIDDLGRTCSDTIFYSAGNPVSAQATPKYQQGIQSYLALAQGNSTLADKRFWLFNGDTISQGDSLHFVFMPKGVHSVCYYAVQTATGCFNVDTIVVEVVENSVAWIPTAFSPNNDGTNDFWEFYIGDFVNGPTDLKVYNRWGNMLYQTSSRHVKWDGSFQGEKIAVGAYVFVLRYGSAVTPKLIHGTIIVID